jgi:hypothetical protein
MDGISPERENYEINLIKKRFPDYDILSSRNIFNNEKKWSDHIDSIIESVDIIIFSCPNECKNGFYFTEKYEHELNLTIKNKKVVCAIIGNNLKLFSDSNWVNTAIHGIKQRR